MTIPVPIPGTPAPITDAQTAEAEALLSEFIRIVARGTSGGTPDLQTPACTIPDNPDPSVLVPVELDTKEKQLFFRQMFLAMVLQGASSFPLSKLRYDVTLLGAINGINTVFTCPDIFRQTPPNFSICVYYNGQRLRVTDDFTVSESGGPTTGYDTVTTLFTPEIGDKLWADYVKP